jgi:hypothetical protein
MRELFETNQCPNEVYQHFAIWSIWSQLSLLYRLYWLLLSLVSLYTLYSAASIVGHFPVFNQRNDSPESSRARLEAGAANLRQVVTAMFFAFGALFFSALPGAFTTLDHSRDLPLNQFIGAFSLPSPSPRTSLWFCCFWTACSGLFPGEASDKRRYRNDGLRPRSRSVKLLLDLELQRPYLTHSRAAVFASCGEP